MADPLEALREPLFPIAPDPAFAGRLRARLVRALTKGTPVSTTTAPSWPAVSLPPSYAGVIPYLAVSDARPALDWYAEAFGARLRGEPIVMPDGRVGHAEIEIAGGVVMLADAHPEIGFVAPEPGAGATVSLHIEMADVDTVTARAVDSGAELERPPADSPYGRNASVRDPFGHRWMLSTPVPSVALARQGDISYVSLWVPDIDRAAGFYANVLGWRYGPGSGPQGRQVEGLSLHHGLWGGEDHSTLFLCLGVDDLAAAVERVQRAGGQADAPEHQPYGLLSACVDDQGMRFALVEVPPGSAARGPENGSVPGDISYVTMEVRDSAKFRAFFAAVLGWTYSPGHVSDGWGVDDVVPMVGLHGGHAEATGVPMYRVDDIAAAVGRVRAAGGSATDPVRQPYGLMSECADDQGTRFYLGQH